MNIATADKEPALTGQEKTNVDLHNYFLANHAEHFLQTRRESFRSYGYGNGSFVPAMIAGVAAIIRRGASTIEGWARGTNVEVVDYRLPRTNSAR